MKNPQPTSTYWCKTGCFCNKAPQTRRLKQERSIVSQSGGWTVKIQVSAGLAPSETVKENVCPASPLLLVFAGISSVPRPGDATPGPLPSPHVHVCVHGPPFTWTQSYSMRTPYSRTTSSLLMTSAMTLFPNKVTF